MTKSSEDKVTMEAAVREVTKSITKFVRFVEANAEKYDSTDLHKVFAYLKTSISAAEQKSKLSIEISGDNFDLDAEPVLETISWVPGVVHLGDGRKETPAPDPNYQQTGGRNVGDKKRIMNATQDVEKIDGVGFIED